MTRRTWPAGPPSPDDVPEGADAGRAWHDPGPHGSPYPGPRPTFTPHGAPEGAPSHAAPGDPGLGQYPYGEPAYREPSGQNGPAPPPMRPYAQQPPAAPAPPGRLVRGGRSGDSRHGNSRHGGGRRGQPKPTFTPRQGYIPPPGGRQEPAYAQPTTTFFAPAGYPQPSFTPFPHGDEPPPSPRGRPAQPGGYAEGGTRVLDVPEQLPSDVPGTGPQRTAGTQPNLARSSKAMALGTIASRGSGFLRTLVLVVALGSGTLANAYNVSNTLPNTVLYLFLGGIFTSVVVPLLVKAAKNHMDHGEGYAERIFTLGAIALLIVTGIGMAIVPQIVDIFLPGATPSAHRVAVIFAYFFIPQIFFYGMDSLLGAILNTKGKFGPNMWTPVINNVVVIAVFGLFIVAGSQVRQPPNGSIVISSFDLNLLGFGTTLGIVIQSLALFPIVKRAGFSFRLRFDFRREELGEIGGMAGWMLGYVVSQFLANLILTIVADKASEHVISGADGYSAYAYANQLFQLPYAIVGLSVISALLPRMSGHATDRRYSLVRNDFSTGVRLASVIVVPAAVFLGILGAPICELLFAYGRESVSQARYTGEVFGLLSLGLIPFMITQLQLRVFYSFQNNRTPAIIGVVMLIVGAAGDLVALAVLPPQHVVLGLGAAYGLMTLAGAAIAWPMLLRHVGSLDGWRITRSLVRMFLATVPGLVWIFVVMAVANSMLRQGTFYGLASVTVGGGGAVLLYAICARVLGIEEFRVLIRTVAVRFGR